MKSVRKSEFQQLKGAPHPLKCDSNIWDTGTSDDVETMENDNRFAFGLAKLKTISGENGTSDNVETVIILKLAGRK